LSIDPVARLAAVPEFSEFPNVDELTAQCRRIADSYAEVAELRRIGTSRLGEPLHCLTVRGGEQQAVVFASVHPNEPVGNLTALHLAETLCADPELRNELGYTWHIVPCIDPDGTRLNEGWFADSADRTHYGRNFYRPAPDEQVEWTFPFAYKKAYFDRLMPETVALMRLIDESRPAFMCSLHNGEMGGIYYYVSRPAPALYPQLSAIPTSLGLPLDTGEPEMPYVERYAPAIFRMSRSADAYDYIESLGLDPDTRDAGDCSAAYAGDKYGTFTLVTEVPYWAHPDADDQTETAETYSAVVHRRGDGLRELHDVLTDTLGRITPDLAAPDSPFLRATRAFAPGFKRGAEQDHRRADAAENNRPATVAERFGCADLVHCFRLRYGGMLLRALDGELAIGNGTPTIRTTHAEFAAIYDDWCEQARRATTADPIPIGKLVAIQYGAILAAAMDLSGEA
jgi:hypothetical protein